MISFQEHRRKWNDCQRCRLCEGRTNVVLARGRVPCDVLFIGEAPGVSEDILNKPFVGPAGKLLDSIVEKAWEKAGEEVDTGGSDPQGKFISGWAPSQATWCMTNLICCIPRAVGPVVAHLKREKYDVRIDRQSEWGNPYVVGKDGSRSEVIAKYREWISEQPRLIEKIPSLAGKKLGCWCSPKPCHGDVLVELFQRIVGNDKVLEPPESAIVACAPRLRELVRMCRPEIVVLAGKLASKHWRVPGGFPAPAVVEIVHPASILRADVSQRGLAIQRCVVTLSDALSEL